MFIGIKKTLLWWQQSNGAFTKRVWDWIHAQLTIRAWVRLKKWSPAWYGWAAEATVLWHAWYSKTMKYVAAGFYQTSCWNQNMAVRDGWNRKAGQMVDDAVWHRSPHNRPGDQAVTTGTTTAGHKLTASTWKTKITGRYELRLVPTLSDRTLYYPLVLCCILFALFC